MSRSPATPGAGEKKLDPAAAAAAAAARINAQLAAKKGIQHVDVPPIRSVATPMPMNTKTLIPMLTCAQSLTPSAVQSPVEKKDGEIYQQDGDYIKDIEVNDLRNRYTLTKGATQKMVNLTSFVA